MNLSTLTKVVTRGKRRLGQGHGSGRVKTAGRGTKGQKARRKIPLFFEGGALPLIKRMPFLRGKGRNYSYNEKPLVVSLEQLNSLPKGSTVDMAFLVKHAVVSEKEAAKRGVKILSDGTLTVALTVALPVSAKAKAKIEKAGGQVIVK